MYSNILWKSTHNFSRSINRQTLVKTLPPTNLWRQLLLQTYPEIDMLALQSQSDVGLIKEQTPFPQESGSGSTLWVKKQDTILLSVTSPNVNLFSKFFHR